MAAVMFFAGGWGYLQLLTRQAPPGQGTALPAAGGSLLSDSSVLLALDAQAWPLDEEPELVGTVISRPFPSNVRPVDTTRVTGASRALRATGSFRARTGPIPRHRPDGMRPDGRTL